MNYKLPFEHNNGIPFKRFAFRLDCSRNAVMNVPAMKRLMDIAAQMGYNAFMFYTEDTYEIEGHPYFGYGRGRLTKAELKELDAYALSKGLELIPDIQTLAHLKTIFRWKHYAEINDCEDILLCEDERTYELIEAMVATSAECFTSRVINLSMDEAELLGRGKYHEKHGDHERIDILKRHMNRVRQICEKYGFEMLMISGDMPFRLATRNDNYSDTQAVVQEDISDLLPGNLVLLYWDYYKRSKEDYTALMRIHQNIKADNLWYFGGTWTWHTFSPENNYAIQGLRNSIQACVDVGLENVVVSSFGDDGGECARFSALPAYFYAAEIARGNTDENSIKEKFEKMFDIPFDQFKLLDLTGRNETEEYCIEPTRYILYNDPFIGLMDTTIPDYTRADHEELVQLLTPWCDHPRWGYMFETMRDLCAVTAEKCDIGHRIRAAYESGDKAKLGELAGELRRIRGLVETFYKSFRRQWLLENKAHGFDVSNVRIGGVMNRLDYCADRLEDYVAGRIDRVEELEEKLLDVRTPASDSYGVKKYLNYWDRNSRYYVDIVSANVVGKGY